MARIRDSHDLTLSNENMERLARKLVEDNPKWLDAWHNQLSDPAAWRRAESEVGRELAREFKRESLTETSDIEAVEASVRGQHIVSDRRSLPTLPPNPSPQQYQKWRNEVLGQ